MSETPGNLRAGLLAAEQVNPTFKERYDMEVQNMLQKTLTPAQRLGFGFSTVLSLAMFLFFGYTAIWLSAGLPVMIRASFGLGSVVSLVWVVMGGRIALSGKMNRRTQPTAMTGMIWGFVVIMQTIFMMVGGQHPDSVVSVFMVLSGLTFVVGGLGFLLRNVIEQSELNMKEKLLGIELRLAELSEKLERKPG